MHSENTKDRGKLPAPSATEQDRHGPLCATTASARRQRLWHALRLYGSLLLCGLAYLICCLTTGLSLPCPFHAVTGLLCPGCGITRLVLALVRLDFAAAFAANQLIFLAGPVLLGLLLRDEYLWVKTGSRPPVPTKFYTVLLLACAVFTVWRNLA